MFVASMLVTLAVAVGPLSLRVAVLIRDSADVALTSDVGNGATLGFPEVSSDVWTNPVVLCVTTAVAVCTADVVNDVRKLSGTLVAVMEVDVVDATVADTPRAAATDDDAAAWGVVAGILLEWRNHDSERHGCADEGHHLGSLVTVLVLTNVSVPHFDVTSIVSGS